MGTGNGYSVKEVLNECEKVTKTKINFEYHPRREGDREYLVSNSIRSKKILNWKPIHSSLNNIIKTAWKWHSKYPKGYYTKVNGNMDKINELFKEFGYI